MTAHPAESWPETPRRRKPWVVVVAAGLAVLMVLGAGFTVVSLVISALGAEDIDADALEQSLAAQSVPNATVEVDSPGVTTVTVPVPADQVAAFDDATGVAIMAAVQQQVRRQFSGYREDLVVEFVVADTGSRLGAARFDVDQDLGAHAG